MKQKAQILRFTIILIFFVILWALVFSPIIGTWANAGIAQNNLTGLEAFFYGNINLFIFIGLVVAMIAVGVYLSST
jgi:hypothetical protein